MFRAAFIDKDGTLIEDVPHNVDPTRIRLAKGAVKGLRTLHAAGFRVIVITNQPGVAHGRFTEESLKEVEEKLRSLMADLGVPLVGFYYCPHHAKGKIAEYAVACSCRKPEPGLILKACEEHDIDIARSWFIGDILDDIEAGHRAGARAVLLDIGNETEWNFSPLRVPDQVAGNLEEAARFVASVKDEVEPAPAPASPAPAPADAAESPELTPAEAAGVRAQGASDISQ